MNDISPFIGSLPPRISKDPDVLDNWQHVARTVAWDCGLPKDVQSYVTRFVHEPACRKHREALNDLSLNIFVSENEIAATLQPYRPANVERWGNAGTSVTFAQLFTSDVLSEDDAAPMVRYMEEYIHLARRLFSKSAFYAKFWTVAKTQEDPFHKHPFPVMASTLTGPLTQCATWQALDNGLNCVDKSFVTDLPLGSKAIMPAQQPHNWPFDPAGGYRFWVGVYPTSYRPRYTLT